MFTLTNALFWLQLFAVIYSSDCSVIFTSPQDLNLFKESNMQHINPAFDPVILKVNANPDPADIVGYKCYISHKQALGGVAKSSVSELNAHSAATSLTEFADLCQCWVSKGRGVNFFRLFHARTAGWDRTLKSWIGALLFLILRTSMESVLYTYIYRYLYIWLHWMFYFCFYV